MYGILISTRYFEMREDGRNSARLCFRALSATSGLVVDAAGVRFVPELRSIDYKNNFTNTNRWKGPIRLALHENVKGQRLSE